MYNDRAEYLDYLALLNPSSSARNIGVVVGCGCGNAGVSREDVLAALAGCSDLESMFVMRLVGAASGSTPLEFADLAYRYGLANGGEFRVIQYESIRGAADVFPPLMEAAWSAYSCPSDSSRAGDRWLSRQIGVSQSKAKSLSVVYRACYLLLRDVELRVSRRLYQQLRRSD